jgi:hypothetical protein
MPENKFIGKHVTLLLTNEEKRTEFKKKTQKPYLHKK